MKIFRSEYVKNISKVSIGVLIAQSLSILLSPIITRLYSPSEFGVFSVYLSIVLVIEVCACLRYEMTIVLAENDEKAHSLFWLSVLIMFAISMAVAIIVLLIYLVSRLGLFQNAFWNVLYGLMPLSVFVISAVNILTLWCTRKKYFTIVAFIQAGLVIFNNILSIVCGYCLAGEGKYLVYSQLSSYVIIAILAGFLIIRKDKELLIPVPIKQLKSLFVEYKRMALFNTPASVVNSLSQRIPAYLFPKVYGLTSVGYFDLVYRILKLPSQIVGNAIRNVFFQKASEEYTTNGSFAVSLKNNVEALTLLSVFPFCLIGALSPWLFPLVFGAEWKDSGWYVLALLPWLATSFIVVPISSAVSITSQDKNFFKLQVYCFIARVLVVIVGAFAFENPIISIACFSLVGCLFQLLILYIIAKSTGIRLIQFFSKRICMYIVSSLIVAGMIFIFVRIHCISMAICLSVIALLFYSLFLKKNHSR